MDKRPNKEVIRQVRNLLRKVNKEFQVEKAILFGSRARGDWLFSSDIDLIIVSEDFSKVDFLDRISIVSRMWNNPIELQPVCYTPEEFKRKKSQIGIVQQALKEGRELTVM